MVPTNQERQVIRRQWNDVARQWKWNQAFPQIQDVKDNQGNHRDRIDHPHESRLTRVNKAMKRCGRQWD